MSEAPASNDGLALERVPRFFVSGRRGADVAQPGVTLELIVDEDRFAVEARRGKGAELSAAIAKAFGEPLIDGPQTVAAGGFDFVGVGPARWHAVSRGEGRVARRAALIAAAQDLASIVDVSHGYTTFRLSGGNVRDALAKLVRIDLDAASFAPGASAGTELHGMTVQLRRMIGGEAYECAVSRSFAGSLYHALIGAADPYGLSIDLAA